MIVAEFEQFYEMKFAKAPKLVKKMLEPPQGFPKIDKTPQS
jgi:hypothetical protein